MRYYLGMIEVGFAIILGFAIASTVCGLLEDGSPNDKVLMRALVYLVVLTMIISFFSGDLVGIRAAVGNLVLGSVFENTIWVLLGGALAILIQVIMEGYFYELWLRLHPQSAPTPEARMGQRAQVAGFRKERTPATLVGTSTEYLNAGLDLRTETLIHLCYSTFEDRGALTMSRLESELRLGTGRRQKAFHKIVAGNRGRAKSKRIVHRYWRSVNGSSRLSQALFGDLCKLARDTHNRDRATIERLTIVGTSLGLTTEEMGRSIRSSL